MIAPSFRFREAAHPKGGFPPFNRSELPMTGNSYVLPLIASYQVQQIAPLLIRPGVVATSMIGIFHSPVKVSWLINICRVSQVGGSGTTGERIRCPGEPGGRFAE